MLLDLLRKGGPVVWPIILCSVVSFAIFFERLWVLQRKKVIPKKLLGSVRELVKAGKISEAKVLCESDTSSIANILGAALNTSHLTKEELKEVVEEAGKSEIRLLEKNVSVLGVIAAIGPLLGLLGTVIGMIRTFDVVSAVGTGDAGKLAGGIAQALIATELGLMVAIPALVAHKICTARAENLTHEMEQSTFNILSLLKHKRANA